MSCEQRDADVDGSRRRLFFMDGVLTGPSKTRALTAGLKKLEGASQSAQHCVSMVRLKPRAAVQHGIKVTMLDPTA